MIQPTTQQLAFARRYLPELFLTDAQRFLKLLSAHGDKLLGQLWQASGKGRLESGDQTQLRYVRETADGVDWVVVHLPHPENNHEAYCIVLRHGKGASSLWALEQVTDATEVRTVVTQMQKLGSARVVGEGAGTEPERFFEFVRSQKPAAKRPARPRPRATQPPPLPTPRSATTHQRPNFDKLTADDLLVGAKARRTSKMSPKRNEPQPVGETHGVPLYAGIGALFAFGGIVIAGMLIAMFSSGAPELPPGKPLRGNILVHDVELRLGMQRFKAWIYTPEEAIAAEDGTEWPVVLIGPAGSRLCHGMKLAKGDRAEHLPYAKAGYIVVAYEIAGAVKHNDSDYKFHQACMKFKSANGGAKNAKVALDYALEVLPIDEDRIYVAGHSSAATLALLVSAKDKRVDACVAYAPAVNVPKALGQGYRAVKRDPSFARFLMSHSPHELVDEMHAPTLLFYAEDDTTISTSSLVSFARKLEEHSEVELIAETRGGHYQPMIKQGIPKAIKWLDSL